MFYVHYPIHGYDQVLDVLSTTKTNSSMTSSIPLADFWHPDRNLPQKEYIIRCLGLDAKNLNEADYCFEYPTPAFLNRKCGKTIRYSKASMTDLMILLGESRRVTIEAKYTEYAKSDKYAPILNEWCNGAEHRKKIIQCWIDYIKHGGRCEISTVDELLKDSPDLPYQFLHRTASACFMCDHPILVYQLFYDNKDDKPSKMKEFEALLKSCAQQLRLIPERLPFYIIEVEVTSPPPLVYEGASDLFTEMKQSAMYTFGTSISILDGYSLACIKQ